MRGVRAGTPGSVTTPPVGITVDVPPVSPARDFDAATLAARLPPYRVLLHNDDVHAMDEVVLALRAAVPGLSTGRAVRIMLEAHFTGRGVVIVCPLERAEYYAARLASRDLTVSIEAAT